MNRLKVGPALRAGRQGVFALVVAVLLTACTSTNKPTASPGKPAPAVETSNVPPSAPREFRAMWVATVKNIDWPSRPGLPVEQQRAEMNALLDCAVKLKLNAVIFQVRPSADALYRSTLEPWTEYLTGVQGRDPGYDPLAEWVSGAHRRGLELHAWFNPYRARHAEAQSPVSPDHIARTHPASVKSYGGFLWMDPGDLFARKRTLDVVRDVVKRYDIDGVHIDDYFYPYPVNAPVAPGQTATKTPPRELDFPDQDSWNRYVLTRGKLNRADWRRENVNRLVEEMWRVVHQTKSWVKFGVSPFGLGRPDRRPPGILGFSQYDKLYADVELWLRNGWLDYLVPQLYWRREQTAQSFRVLLDYWLAQPNPGRPIWPGLNASAINDTPKTWDAEEIVRQIELTRTRPAANGHVHYSAIALLQDRRKVATRLAKEIYSQVALVPAMPWLSVKPPAAPAFTVEKESLLLAAPAAGKSPALHAVWRRYGENWTFTTQPASWGRVTLSPQPELGPVDAVVVSAIDRAGIESPHVTWVRAKTKPAAR